MAITILSPYSGLPVKIRDRDLGRAIRDEEGRIFYVVPRSDGSGHYAAPTRKGSEKDEQRYLDLERKVGEQGEVARAAQEQPVHDATGPGRPVNWLRLLVLLLIVLAAIGVATWLLLDVEITPMSPNGGEPAPMDEPLDEPVDDEPLDDAADEPAERVPGGPVDADEPLSRTRIESEVAFSFEPMMLHSDRSASAGGRCTIRVSVAAA